MTNLQPISISAVILTKNEENNIVDCIDSVSWCDEILVIDGNSEDRTAEIVRNLRNNKIKIFTNSLNNDFSQQRNFGLQMAKGEWVLFVDADERITESLKKEIGDVTYDYGRGQKLNGYFIKRRDSMWGRELKHGETGNIKLLRLGRKDAGKWQGKVHEEWKIKGKIGQLKNHLHHYPHQTIAEFLKEINFYTDIRAQELFDKKVKAYWWSILLYPKVKFFVNYFIKRGFLDGLPGLIFAIFMSFHSFLVRGKLWILTNK